MPRRRPIDCQTAMLHVILLTTITVGAARLPAQQRDTPAIVGALPFANGVVGDEHASLSALASGVPELILLELARNPAVRPVEPARVRRVLSSQKLDAQGRIDDEAASRVGRILGARWVIRGTYTSDGHGTIRILAYTIDGATGRVERSTTVEGKEANLAALICQISEHLGRDMHLAELPRDEKRARELTQKASYETTLSFARAIEARDAGRVQQAITMLQELLANDPEYEPAQDELTRLHSDRGR